VPDDRFGDLDPSEARRGGRSAEGGPDPAGGPGQGSAAERLSELDAREPEPDRPSPEVPPPARPGSRYAWVVGVAALLAVLVATYTTLVQGEGTGEGFRGPEPGEPLPAFAAPAPTSDLEGDANVIQREDVSPDAEVPPACDVHGRGVVRVCAAPFPVVITFVTEGCESQLDVVEAVREDFRAVRFVGVYSNSSLEDVAELVRTRGWGFDIAVDPDRPEIFNLYRAGDCPTTVFAEAGGNVVRTLNGTVPEQELRAAAADVAPGGEAPGA
jgi:hypothetical protein